MNGSADRNTSRISPERFTTGAVGYSFDVALDLARLSAQAYRSAQDKAWVVNMACTKPKDHGLAAER